MTRSGGVISVRRAPRLRSSVARRGAVVTAASVVLGAGLVAFVPASLAGASTASSSSLAAEANRIQAEAVAESAQLHALATSAGQWGAQLQTVDAEIASDNSALQVLQVKLAQAATTLRAVALDEYMQDASATTSLDDFMGSPTETAATADYQQLVTGSESDDLAAYQQAQQAVTHQQTQLAAQQAAAQSDYQSVNRQYAALQAAAQAEQADLASVRKEEAYLATQGPPRTVDFTDLVGGNGSLAQDFYRLRVCESGDDYRDDTGNGYYGAYQFSLSTWEGLGDSGLPSNAPPAQQDQVAYQLYRRAGWGQWPECAAMLGLH